jgi:hypothetical protein
MLSLRGGRCAGHGDHRRRVIAARSTVLFTRRRRRPGVLTRHRSHGVDVFQSRPGGCRGADPTSSVWLMVILSRWRVDGAPERVRPLAGAERQTRATCRLDAGAIASWGSHEGAHGLDVGVPATLGAAVRVRDRVAETRALAADVAVGSHGASPPSRNGWSRPPAAGVTPGRPGNPGRVQGEVRQAQTGRSGPPYGAGAHQHVGVAPGHYARGEP